MALDRTSGFDMLVQISETELNNQLATLFLAGSGFPTMLSVPINMGAVVGTATLNFGTPTADLDRPRPQMGLTLPFTNSQLQVTAPLPATLAPLGGTITIVDAIEMITQGTNQIATMDFNNGAPNVTVFFDVPSQAILAPALAAAGLTLAQAQNLMAGFVVQQLQTSMGRLDLTPPIPVVDDADPTTVFDIDVTTVNDTSVSDRDCLTFGVRMANDSGGNINGVTTSFIPAGSESLVMMSNFWLLARVMRPRVAAALGLSVTDFDTPLRLNHNVAAPGGQGTLTNLEARVEGNRIRVDGRATASGTGWSAESNFTFFIDITLSGGAINVVATTPTVDTDVDLAWWVWLLSLGLGALFGGIIGAIIAAIVLAIVEAVAEGIVNNLVSSGIGGALGGIPAIPLGPIGGGLTLNTIILDDLELRCSIIRSVSVPMKNSGSYASLAALAIDLDTGMVRSSAFATADLVWDGGMTLSTNGPAGLTITGTSFGSLTPVQISRLSLSSHNISATLIPLAAPPSFPFFSHQAVIFGVRTAEGRLAKVRAWRNVFAGGRLELEWATYDTPIPQLDIAGRWSVVERGPSTEYITPDCSYCTSRTVRRIGHFEAWPRLVAFPIDYQFCLCGTVLAEGEGTVSTANGPLDYKLEGRRLTIETDMGQNVDCELCVSAIDARGQELFTCTQLSQRGIENRCRRCAPKSVRTRTDIVPAQAALNAWRPLITDGYDKITNAQ
ncbi:MAG: hypothetical protein AABO58_23120 [Acidobacteriota bacterium]